MKAGLFFCAKQEAGDDFVPNPQSARHHEDDIDLSGGWRATTKWILIDEESLSRPRDCGFRFRRIAEQPLGAMSICSETLRHWNEARG